MSFFKNRMTDHEHPIAPPVLSTPDTHLFEHTLPLPATGVSPRLSDDKLHEVYEISRTASDIYDGGWRRIALQFPDNMLHDAPRVFEALAKELNSKPPKPASPHNTLIDAGEDVVNQHSTISAPTPLPVERERERLYILADTTYGACCVDEIAAEHVDADVVVHYGRSCLSPTARLPVIYVFTTRPLNVDFVVEAFEHTYLGRDVKVILMADVIYHSHIVAVKSRLENLGYNNLVVPEVVHNPSSIIPSRRVDEGLNTKEYSLFHISDPPPSLLLTLSSRVKDMHIYPTTSPTPQKALSANTSMALRRRYAILTSLSTCAIYGILVNTLSVRNYLETVTKLQQQISAAGKKSYTFVVGKVNAAKVANFSEIGGWVVVGCWESSLIESTEFYRPIITPFELNLALMRDDERIWSGEWTGDFMGFLQKQPSLVTPTAENGTSKKEDQEVDSVNNDGGNLDSEEESAPPEFDLRTGRYVSHSRPMRSTPSNAISPETEQEAASASNVLTRRAKGDLATINGAVSPGAEYLRSQRTWTGLGSDFHDNEASSAVEEGRSGVARGYTVGGEGEKR